LAVPKTRKYIVDIVGGLPVILMELNSTGGIVKTYIYVEDPLGVADPMGTNSEIIAQHDGDHTADIYFYLHDRLGSVRLVIADNGDVAKHYTYEPFGLTYI